MRTVQRRGLALPLLLGVGMACRDTPTTDVTDPPLPECGDGRIDTGEQCDGTSLGGKSCVGEGFDTGTLGCTSSCFLDVSACVRFCGNDTIDTGEGCDGVLGPLTCDTFGFTGCSSECQVDASHCIHPGSSFTGAESRNVAQGGAAAIATAGPGGFGALAVAVPVRSELHITRHSRTGWQSQEQLLGHPGTTPELPLAVDLDGDEWTDLAFIGEDGRVHRDRYDPVAKIYTLALLNDAAACWAHRWVGPLARETAPGMDLVALASCPPTGGAAAPPNAVLLMPAEGGVTPTWVDAPGITSAALADLDGDGTTDILYTATGSSAVHTLVRGGPGFGPGQSYSVEVDPPFVPSQIVAADFDRDGAVDVALSDGAQVVVVERMGTSLTPRATLAGRGTHLLAEDADGDGRTDLLWMDTDVTGAIVRMARNAGDFTFTELSLTTGASGEPLSLSMGDLDADGDLDVAATLASPSGSSTFVFHNRVR
ncbi:MAG: VCBS repeat-containing protein [Myxococcaceae bacterium]|nr:VCBS repeat-containing protein [Myxococcaceae bacterium]MCI0670442.1 VCBS repeat-containing protein [Myxococcaceae bacterium]